MDRGGGDAEFLLDHRQGFAQSARGAHRNDGLGRGVLLGVDLQRGGGVEIHRQRVVGQVGVVDAVAGDAGALGPLAEVFEVLAQAIGEVLAAAARIDRACYLGRRRLHVEQQQLAGQIAVVERVHLLGAQAQALAEVGAAGENGCAPAAKMLFQCDAEQAVELDQLRFAAEPFAVRRVGDQQAGDLPLRAGSGGIGLRPLDLIAQAGQFGIAPGGAQGGAVDVLTEQRRQAGQGRPFLRSRAFVEQGFPQVLWSKFHWRGPGELHNVNTRARRPGAISAAR